MYELIHGNCIEVLRSMPDKSVDCIVTDPPYGVGLDYVGYDDTVENLHILVRDALPEMRRVAKRVALTSGLKQMWLYPPPNWVLAWTYFGGGHAPWGWNGWQPILVYGTDPDLRLRMRRADVVRSASDPDLRTDNDHPCPKPLPFVRKLINRVAPSPSDTILDPFMGSGTTGVAAIQLGHNRHRVERRLPGDREAPHHASNARFPTDIRTHSKGDHIVNVPDISNLNYAELSTLRALVADRIKEMRDTGITQLRATIAEQANMLGVDLKDLVPKKTRKKRKARDEGDPTS